MKKAEIEKKRFCKYCKKEIPIKIYKWKNRIFRKKAKHFCDKDCKNLAHTRYRKSLRGMTYEDIYIKRKGEFANIFAPKIPKTKKDLKEYRNKLKGDIDLITPIGICQYCGASIFPVRKEYKDKYGRIRVSYRRNKVFCDIDCKQTAIAEHHSSKKGKNYTQIFNKRQVKFKDIFLKEPKNKEEINDIKNKLKNPIYNKLMPEIKKLYKQGHGTEFIANNLNCCQSVVLHRLQKEGINTNRKYIMIAK